MAVQRRAMHVARNKRTYVAKSGEQRVYESVLVRRTYRDGGQVRHETLANLSALPAETVAAIEATLKGELLVPAGQAVTITASVPHGHVAAVHAMAVKLGLPAMLGSPCAQRDLALALVISRVASPASRPPALTWWAGTTLGTDLGVAAASTDQVYAAMDWLAGRQDAIEGKLAARHLAPQPDPPKMALFDLSGSWLEGRCCPVATHGYSRDGQKGKLQIEYVLLTDPEGRPVAVRVLPGNTGDPAAFTDIVTVVRDKFGLEQMVMVGDRGMITSARIRALNQLEDETQQPGAYGWITALRARAIRKLMASGGPLQMSLFDQQDLAEITHPDYPGERLIACRNPVLVTRRQPQMDAEAALDGFYVLRTPVQASQLDAPGVAAAYQNLKYVERDFRHVKADDLDPRPIYHYPEERVKAQLLTCMLACYLTWHLRRAWTPLIFTDENLPAGGDPVAPARRSPRAQANASTQHDQANRPYRSFHGLLAHLATLTRNQVRFAGATTTVPMLTEPTSAQRAAFQLIGVPIPVTLK
jgi:Transposase DDE domain